ncbi:MAG: LysM peptidoglycan-binding domain-containing M23 family metallopeptidase [Bdellovibrionota bacterium]
MNRRVTRLLVCVLTLCLFLTGCGVSGYGAREAERKVPVYYNVQRGDTVWTISKRFNVEHDSILLLNGITDVQQLQPGRRLLVGYRYPREGEARTTSASLRLPSERPRQYPSVGRQSPSGKSGELLWPVNVGHVVSGFGPRSSTFHDGIDIACVEGTPVIAAHAGTVVYSGSKLSGYGNLVILRHPTGLTTVYAHNSELLVSTGQKVRRGEEIAESGATGHATGPHLHFEVRMRDSKSRYVAVDPLPLLTGEASAPLRYRVNETLAPILTRLFD